MAGAGCLPREGPIGSCSVTVLVLSRPWLSDGRGPPCLNLHLTMTDLPGGKQRHMPGPQQLTASFSALENSRTSLKFRSTVP